jgi:Phasin protein
MDCLEGDNRCARCLFQSLSATFCALQQFVLKFCALQHIPARICATYSAEARELHEGSEMADIQRFGDEFQRASKDGLDASVRSFGEMNKGFQAIAATVIDYSKKSFEDGTHAMQQLVGAKSFEQVWEIQSQYAKKAFDAYVAQASKIGEMYVDLARSSYQPVEQAPVRTARKA